MGGNVLRTFDFTDCVTMFITTWDKRVVHRHWMSVQLLAVAPAEGGVQTLQQAPQQMPIDPQQIRRQQGRQVDAPGGQKQQGEG